MSRINVENIRHPDAASDSLQLSDTGNITAPGNLSVTGTSTLTGNTVVTGSLTANGLAYPTAGPLSNRNLIINGAMQVAQRGTSATNSGYGSVDRFFAQAQNGAITHSQTAITSGTPYDEGFRNVLRMTNTTANTAADAIRNPFQYIEAQNLANSGWNYTSSSSHVTLSFWVRSSVAQEFYGYLRTFDGTEQRYCFSLGSLSADTWTKVTKVIPGNSNITIDNNSGAGLQVNISPFWGTDFTDSGVSVDTWGAYSSGTRTPDYTNTWAGTTGATFDLTGVQLEVGSVATPFEHRSYGDELRRCQRYCEILEKGDSTEATIGIGLAYSTTRLLVAHSFKVTKRASPSLTLSGTTGDVELLEHGGSWTDATSVGVRTNVSMARIDATAGSAIFTGGEAGELRIEGTTKLIFACEL